MGKNKVISPEEAVKLIKMGDTIAICGNGSLQVPDKVLEALEKRFLTSGQPRNLTALLPVAPGALKGTGGDRLGHEGFVKRVIMSCFTPWEQGKIKDLIVNDKVEAYCFPMGTLCRLLHNIAARDPGHLTSVGLHTFIDPRNGGGKYNRVTKEDLVELVEIGGKEALLFKAFPVDVSIIRGTTADEDGYISTEWEPSTQGVLAFALAAKNSGGKVIAQVNRLTKRGTLDPRLVKIPGNLVNVIVVDKDQKNTHKGNNFSLVGEVQAPDDSIEPLPLTLRKVIARRAVLEIKSGDCVDLGYGIPVGVSFVAQEEGLCNQITFCTEHGGFGGMPAEQDIFGATINPRAMLDSLDTFIFFDGGGLDICFLSFAQVDKEGNVNVSRLGDVIYNTGGFIDITHRTKKLVFCGTFTAGAIKAEVKNLRLNLIQEGKNRKFLSKVDQITQSGRGMKEKGQEVLFVTERAVFRLTSEGLCLIEIAPGVDLQRHILEQMEFRPIIDNNLKLMENKIFSEESMKVLGGF